MNNPQFDMSALINTQILAALQKDGSKNGKDIAAIINVFTKRGISALDALAILLELCTVITLQTDDGEEAEE